MDFINLVSLCFLQLCFNCVDDDAGLFKYSRHPNYFAEQCIWVCVYLYTVPVSGTWLHYSISGITIFISILLKFN
jgi:steroid 5-alpha reductase family enzyme